MEGGVVWVSRGNEVDLIVESEENRGVKVEFIEIWSIDLTRYW